MGLMQRRRELIAMQTGELPGTYRRVEYLSSKNNIGQYIDTGVELPPAVDNTIICRGKSKLDKTSWVSAFGARGTEFCIQRNSVSDNINVEVNGFQNASVYTLTEADANGVEFELSKSLCVINGGTIAISSGNTHYAGSTIWLFGKLAANGAGMDVKGTVEIYWFQIYNGSVLVRDFVPCVRKSDSKPGMYDTVTKQFFTNAGAGEFIVPA